MIITNKIKHDMNTRITNNKRKKRNNRMKYTQHPDQNNSKNENIKERNK